MSRFISIAALTPRNIRLDDCPLIDLTDDGE